MTSKWGIRIITVVALLSVGTACHDARSEPMPMQENAKFAHVQFSCATEECLFFDTRTGDLWLWQDGRPFKHMGRLIDFSQPLAEHPRTAAALEDAYVESMKNDLRNLVTAQEAHFADSVKYTTNLGTAFYVTTGVTSPTITLTPDGWTATVGHQRLTKKCVIYIGTTRIAPATQEGVPACN